MSELFAERGRPAKANFLEAEKTARVGDVLVFQHDHRESRFRRLDERKENGNKWEPL